MTNRHKIVANKHFRSEPEAHAAYLVLGREFGHGDVEAAEQLGIKFNIDMIVGEGWAKPVEGGRYRFVDYIGRTG